MKEHPLYKGYWLTEDGCVFSSLWGYMRPCKLQNSGWDYKHIVVRHEKKSITRRVHILMADTYLGPREPGQCVMHINDDGTDNRLCNLRIGTPKENTAQLISERRFSRQFNKISEFVRGGKPWKPKQ